MHIETRIRHISIQHHSRPLYTTLHSPTPQPPSLYTQSTLSTSQTFQYQESSPPRYPSPLPLTVPHKPLLASCIPLIPLLLASTALTYLASCIPPLAVPAPAGYNISACTIPCRFPVSASLPGAVEPDGFATYPKTHTQAPTRKSSLGVVGGRIRRTSSVICDETAVIVDSAERDPRDSFGARRPGCVAGNLSTRMSVALGAS